MRSAISVDAVIFVGIWCLCIIGLLALFGLHLGVTGNPSRGIVASLGMAGFGVGFAFVGRRMGRTDENEIVAFLMRALDAKERPNEELQPDDHLGRSASSGAGR